ncbi:MAG TPA: UDP-3-O-acyl-N-acetylglucosamine deacetylase [Caulobacteraceae bacterium]|nr:UDP-3-O-acyl-N-acetylglucosamine deacetylase [Caulobacteraceae bacterium]
MWSQFQHTLGRQVRLSGVGVHTGAPTSIELVPASADTGIVFERTDIGGSRCEIAARAQSVVETRLGTVVANEFGVRVSTVEHLMAALYGLGVDNVRVRIDGPEAPIMDGSAGPFVDLIDRAGLRTQGAPRLRLQVLETVEVRDGAKRAALLPCDGFEVSFEIAFDAAPIGRQTLAVSLDQATFRSEVAAARTFGFAHEVEALRAAGLARGGSLENVVVIDGERILNPEGLRRPDEFVRHKMLDAVGDLALLGYPLLARYEARYAGHALNNALARALLARPEAWRLVDPSAAMAHAV